MIYSVSRHFQQYFSYIMKTSFSGGRSRREPSTMGKQLVNFISCGCESSAPFFVIYKAGREPTPYFYYFFEDTYKLRTDSPKQKIFTQSTTEIVVPSSTIDDSPHCMTMYMYLRGGSRHFHKGDGGGVSCKPITNAAWVRTQLCKVQKRVHSTRSLKW